MTGGTQHDSAQTHVLTRADDQQAGMSGRVDEHMPGLAGGKLERPIIPCAISWKISVITALPALEFSLLNEDEIFTTSGLPSKRTPVGQSETYTARSVMVVDQRRGTDRRAPSRPRASSPAAQCSTGREQRPRRPQLLREPPIPRPAPKVALGCFHVAANQARAHARSQSRARGPEVVIIAVRQVDQLKVSDFLGTNKINLLGGAGVVRPANPQQERRFRCAEDRARHGGRHRPM
jgi:hypothetical protein